MKQTLIVFVKELKLGHTSIHFNDNRYVNTAFRIRVESIFNDIKQIPGTVKAIIHITMTQRFTALEFYEIFFIRLLKDFIFFQRNF